MCVIFGEKVLSGGIINRKQEVTEEEVALKMLFPVFVTLFLWIQEWKTTCLRTDAVLKQLAAHCGFSYLKNRFLTSGGRRTLRMQKWKHPLLAAECSSHHLPEVIKKLFWVIKEITTWGRRRWGLLGFLEESFNVRSWKVEGGPCLRGQIQMKGKRGGWNKWTTARCDCALQKHRVIPSF